MVRAFDKILDLLLVLSALLFTFEIASLNVPAFTRSVAANVNLQWWLNNLSLPTTFLYNPTSALYVFLITLTTIFLVATIAIKKFFDRRAVSILISAIILISSFSSLQLLPSLKLLGLFRLITAKDYPFWIVPIIPLILFLFFEILLRNSNHDAKPVKLSTTKIVAFVIWTMFILIVPIWSMFNIPKFDRETVSKPASSFVEFHVVSLPKDLGQTSRHLLDDNQTIIYTYGPIPGKIYNETTTIFLGQFTITEKSANNMNLSALNNSQLNISPLTMKNPHISKAWTLSWNADQVTGNISGVVSLLTRENTLITIDAAGTNTFAYEGIINALEPVSKNQPWLK